MTVLVTGGAGYIGSTIVTACRDAGLAPVIIDNLSSGDIAYTDGFPFYCGDIQDDQLVRSIFADHPDIAQVVHCAADISVPESSSDPLRYYQNNVAKLVSLLQSLRGTDCRQIIFSSSASVYGSASQGGITEDAPLDPRSPYARTKCMAEAILRDAAAAFGFHTVVFRYFNPIGTDPGMRSGPLAAAARNVVTELFAAHQSGAAFYLNGTDWPTRDGTPLRDFIHVWDVAQAHVAAVELLQQRGTKAASFEVFNIGSGRGTTIRELVEAFRDEIGPVDCRDAAARVGDVAGNYAVCERAKTQLGWVAERSVAEALHDAARWLSRATNR